jgi:hypothetical protein
MLNFKTNSLTSTVLVLCKFMIFDLLNCFTTAVPFMLLDVKN